MLKNELSDIVITCLPKLSWVVADEIRQLGFSVYEERFQSVTTRGNLKDCIFLNLSMRSANRILLHIKSFKSNNPEQLYKSAKGIPWETMISPDGYVSLTSYVKNDTVRDHRFANLKVKDAVVDRMMEKTGRRPDSGSDTTKTVVFLHWVGVEAKLYFDTSGETISKHGYRKFPHKAPLHETLAVSIIKASNWKKGEVFVNPMCGSGTLAIEAALMNYDLLPAIGRRNFGFMHLSSYKIDDWHQLRKRFQNSVIPDKNCRIIATDISGRAIEAAIKNAKAAGVEQLIEFKKCPFEKTHIPEGDGVVIINPEYGERLGSETELESTYQSIGDFFKKKCVGKKGFIFTGNLKLAKKVGLRTSKRTEFLNGKIECRLLEYELYEGTK